MKQRIVALLDAEVYRMAATIANLDPGLEQEDKNLRRDLAIFIRQRNKFAKDADISLMELTEKDGTGKFIYRVE